MTAAGKISIALYHRNGRASGVRIASARPDAARALPGKTPEQTLTVVPLLFSLCGNGQAHAALQACRAALGMAAESRSDAARELLVQLETLREHVWRILLDWPGFAGLEADKKPLAALLKFDARFKRLLFRDGQAFKLDSVLDIDARQLTELITEVTALIDAAIFNGRLNEFQALTAETQLRDWLRQNRTSPAGLLNDLYRRDWMAAGRNGIACLPELDSRALSRQLRQEDSKAYSRMPHWQGRCFETTPLSRQLSQPLIAELQGHYRNGMMVRFLACLLEVSSIPSRLRRLLERMLDCMVLAADGEFGDGLGLGQVQAARGLLIHHVELRHGLVKDYCIVAPTEWNFHPQGVVAQGLKSLQADDPAALRLQAELLINSVDPCVQYDLNLMDGDNETEIHA